MTDELRAARAKKFKTDLAFLSPAQRETIEAGMVSLFERAAAVAGEAAKSPATHRVMMRALAARKVAMYLHADFLNGIEDGDLTRFEATEMGAVSGLLIELLTAMEAEVAPAPHRHAFVDLGAAQHEACQLCRQRGSEVVCADCDLEACAECARPKSKGDRRG